jgi:hypothetical protein
MPLDAAYPSRQELIALNEHLAEATAARDAAQESYDRLERPTRLLTDVSREYAAEKAVHDAAIVVWYQSGCPGVRPDVPSRMVELERQLGDLRGDLSASAIALEIAASGLQAANEVLAELFHPTQSGPIQDCRRGRQGSSRTTRYPSDGRGDAPTQRRRGSSSRTT